MVEFKTNRHMPYKKSQKCRKCQQNEAFEAKSKKKKSDKLDDFRRGTASSASMEATSLTNDYFQLHVLCIREPENPSIPIIHKQTSEHHKA